MIKILFILIFLISGCATGWYPKGDYGDRTRYKYNPQMYKCSFCKQPTLIYKYSKNKKIICDKCYKKIRRDR